MGILYKIWHDAFGQKYYVGNKDGLSLSTAEYFNEFLSDLQSLSFHIRCRNIRKFHYETRSYGGGECEYRTYIINGRNTHPSL
jgi:hypothetical protein